MILPNESYITDAEGNRVAVVLDLETYERLLQAFEDLEDIRAANAALADDPEGLPFDEAMGEIQEERASLQQTG